MKIFTFWNTAADAPAGARALARIWTDMPGKGGKMAPGWHPVIVTGATEDEAREKTQAWWASEIARAAAKAGPRGKAKAMEAAPGTAEIEDEEAIG